MNSSKVIFLSCLLALASFAAAQECAIPAGAVADPNFSVDTTTTGDVASTSFAFLVTNKCTTDCKALTDVLIRTKSGAALTLTPAGTESACAAPLGDGSLWSGNALGSLASAQAGSATFSVAAANDGGIDKPLSLKEVCPGGCEWFLKTADGEVVGGSISEVEPPAVAPSPESPLKPSTYGRRRLSHKRHSRA